MKAKIIRVACKGSGWRWVVDDEKGERHHLIGPGAPKDGKVGDVGTLRYVSGASFGNWFWEPDKIISLDDLTHDDLRKGLAEALNLLEANVSGQGCSYARVRIGRPPGECCAEFKTWEQGVLHAGCAVCRARAFLAQFGIIPWL